MGAGKTRPASVAGCLLKLGLVVILIPAMLIALLLVSSYLDSRKWKAENITEEKAGQAEPEHLLTVESFADKGLYLGKACRRALFPPFIQRTAGSVGFRVFWRSASWTEERSVTKMEEGRLDAALLSAHGTLDAVPEMSVLSLPFLFEGYEEVDFLRREMRQAFDDAASRRGLKIIAWLDQGFDRIFSRRNPLCDAESFRGARFIPWCGPLDQKLVKGLESMTGPQPFISSDEYVMFCSRDGYSANDSIIAPPQMMIENYWFPCAAYFSSVEIRYSPALFVMARESWNNLPRMHRKVMEGARDSVEERCCAAIRAENEKALKALIKYGIVETRMSPEALAELKVRLIPLWREEAGTLYPEELLDEVLGRLGDFRAGKSAEK